MLKPSLTWLAFLYPNYYQVPTKTPVDYSYDPRFYNEVKFSDKVQEQSLYSYFKKRRKLFYMYPQIQVRRISTFETRVVVALPGT